MCFMSIHLYRYSRWLAGHSYDTEEHHHHHPDRNLSSLIWAAAAVRNKWTSILCWRLCKLRGRSHVSTCLWRGCRSRGCCRSETLQLAHDCPALVPWPNAPGCSRACLHSALTCHNDPWSWCPSRCSCCSSSCGPCETSRMCTAAGGQKKLHRSLLLTVTYMLRSFFI